MSNKTLYDKILAIISLIAIIFIITFCVRPDHRKFLRVRYKPAAYDPITVVCPSVRCEMKNNAVIIKSWAED